MFLGCSFKRQKKIIIIIIITIIIIIIVIIIIIIIINVNAFQSILERSERKPNKIWVDQGSEF